MMMNAYASSAKESTAEHAPSSRSTSEAGYALVAADADTILKKAGRAQSTEAWHFHFEARSNPPSEHNDGGMTLTITLDDYAVIEQADSIEIIDYALGRVFYPDPSVGTFQSTSLSTSPYFRAVEWTHRGRMASLLANTGGGLKAPSISVEFWRSQNLSLRPSGAQSPPVDIIRSDERLTMKYEGQDVASAEAANIGVPAAIAARFWDVLMRYRALHPTFLQRAKEAGIIPARLVYTQRLTSEPQSTELRLTSHSRGEQSYPLTRDMSVVRPSTAGNPNAAGLVAVAWDAAQGRFASGEPDTAFWVERFKEAELSDDVFQIFLTNYALYLYTGSNSLGCDGTANLDPAALCDFVKAAADRLKGDPEALQLLSLIGASDELTKRKAVIVFEVLRGRAGGMAPLLDVLAANHINDLTRTVTRGKGRLDRNDAIPLYLSGLKAFPFMRQFYGDIADYYFKYFDMQMGFYFADVGRSLPVPGPILPGYNLIKTGETEQKLRRDFPSYY